MTATLAAFLIAGLSAGPAFAQAVASGWAVGHNARARLIPGPRDATGDRLVGIQIDIGPGWHTYWRNPGDAGVPPAFDWTGSVNLDTAEVMWPAPVAIDSGFGVSIGYEDDVVFPVRLKPANAGRPIDLVLRLDYAVCDEICIPLSADLALTVEPEASQFGTEQLVEASRARVPRLQGGSDATPRIVGAQAASRGERIVLLVEAEADGAPSMFVEGPPEYYFSVPPAPEAIGRGALRFTVEVDGARAVGDLRGKTVGATLVSGDEAVEHWWVVE